MAWDEGKHPRNSKGSAGGGRFKKGTKGGTTSERRKALKGESAGVDDQGRTKAQRGERRRAQTRDVARAKKTGKQTAASKRATKATKGGGRRTSGSKNSRSRGSFAKDTQRAASQGRSNKRKLEKSVKSKG